MTTTDPPVVSTLPSAVGDALRSLITEGTLAPGSRLNERALCDRLGVSRTPLREAFRELASEGLIELTAGQLDAAESERVRAAGLEPDALARQLTHLPRVSAPFSLPMLRAAPAALAWLFSDPMFTLSARVSSLRAAGAAARGEHLVAWVEARGSLLLEQK